MKKKLKMKGFTLIELVVVISIILILVSIAFPKYKKSNLNAQVAAHNVNVKEIKNAAILYLVENPEAKEIDITKMPKYFEGGIPKPARELTEKQFTIELKDGDVIVHPGEIEIKDGKIVEKSSGKTE